MASSSPVCARTRQPAVFIPHGGGPRVILGHPGYAELVTWLKAFRKTYLKTTPDAIVIITAHWEENVPTITSAAHPTMLYDYSGFAPEAYQIQYPAPGHPQLAHRIKSLLAEYGLPAKLDSTRGNDHGTFIPMKLMFPEAEVPTVQMSLYDTLDPEQHIKMGEALSSLRDDNILIIGSGLSFHSFKHFFGNKVKANRVSEPFHEFLVDALVHTTDPSERRKKMNQWLQAPYAREVHPREEHLMPLFVATGAGLHEPCQEIYSGLVMDIRTSGFLFGGESTSVPTTVDPQT
ncbi:hypothetical protein Poli38472_012440 [Pythium oligandrum]|uniref:Extradiol ring-cleavage dioxygenase class III enzyme subunit B domain-containing protein n=1 Tax=Pythium oligandrum TaxID=41045 RepID=A0A8K1CQD5_PYTOL|nr:hypothetical protein Poli38472_012440 [Pythium oligandrum]|eukprot:TMW67324.1 hypothetical protein Poli38472_012440 [Pythium oligandrum]